MLKYHLSVAACNFSHNLIDGGGFDKVYSILPSFVRGRLDDVTMDGLVYSSLRKGLFRRVAFLIENVTLFRKIPKQAVVWFYNLTILVAPLIVMLRLFKPSVKLNVIVLDYTPSRKPLERFFLWLINHMDGTIRLAQSPLFTVKNSLCLPGVVPQNTPEYPRIEHMEKSFLISGMLGENISMLSMLLEAFSQMPDLLLHITGVLNDKSILEKYRGCRNIIYHGQVAYGEYLNILHATSFLLSTRNPLFPENQCNFPSKIIEALLHNRIIVSTISYSQLEGIRYLTVSSKIDLFVRDIRKIAAMKESDLLLYANQSQIVKQRFNVQVWNEAMAKIENKEL